LSSTTRRRSHEFGPKTRCRPRLRATRGRPIVLDAPMEGLTEWSGSSPVVPGRCESTCPASRREEIERVEHQRCRPFVSKNVIVGLGLEKARVGGVLLPGTPCPARVVERAFALRDGDEGRSRMCVPTGASAGVDGYLLKRSVARGRRATGRQLFHGLDLNLDPPRIGPGQKLLVSETTPSKQSAHSLP